MGIIEPGDKALQECKGHDFFDIYKWNCAGEARLSIEEKGLKVWMGRAGDIRVPGLKADAHEKFVANDVVRSKEHAIRRKRARCGAERLPPRVQCNLSEKFSKKRVDEALSLSMQSTGEMGATITRGGRLVGDTPTPVDMCWVLSMKVFVANQLLIDQRTRDRRGQRRAELRVTTGAEQVGS